MNTKCLIVLICSVLGIQALHCSDAGSAVAGISLITKQLFEVLVKPTVTVEEVKKILDDGAKVNAKELFTDETPLHYAARSHSQHALAIVRFLLANDADVTARSRRGRTPLHYAAMSSSPQAHAIVEHLLANGAIAQVIDTNSQTLLHYAVRNHTPYASEIIRLLLANGADVDVNTQDNFGQTPLHYAVTRYSPQDLNIVDLLLANGALVNVRDNRGQTPLHYAAHGHLNLDGIRGYVQYAPAIITFLLANGADVNAIDNDGQTPLDLAIHADNPEIIALFITAIEQRGRWSPLRSGWFAAAAAAGVYPAPDVYPAPGDDTASGGGGTAGASDAGL